MIKREYFISLECHDKTGCVSKSFRQFYIKSLFPYSPTEILIMTIREVAKEMKVDENDIIVTAFNRV